MSNARTKPKRKILDKEGTINAWIVHPIRIVVANKLCNGCGTCAGICSNSAIGMRISSGIYVPIVDISKCKQCGDCISVCPGFSTDFSRLNELFFRRAPDNIKLGNFNKCHLGRSTDEEITRNSSSGGLITSLLVFLLEKGTIDGAVVTRMSRDNPLEPEVFVATTKEDIKSAAQSKYCPVPVNTAIQRILAKDGHYAIVGLPCHIQGMRKAETLNPRLKEKIILHLGLFCGHNVDFLGTEFVLRKLAISMKEVQRIDYRKFQFPGTMSIQLRNGSKKVISHLEFWRSLFSPSSFFAPTRCTLCGDCTAEFADVSFGTAWLPELKGAKYNVCLSRSQIGDRILQYAQESGKVYLREIDWRKIVEAEKGIIDFTKRKLKARLELARILGKEVPRYKGLKLIEPRIVDYPDALLVYLRAYLSSRRSTWKFLLRITPKIRVLNTDTQDGF